MKKNTKSGWLYLCIIIMSCLNLTIQGQNLFKSPKFKVYSPGVPAAPYELKLIQPDGSILDAYFKGDGAVHWYQTPDGYTIMKGESGYYEYAVPDMKGNLKSSGIRTNNKSQRKPEELDVIAKTTKELRYSSSQIEILKNSFLPAPANDPGKSFPTTGTRNLLLILIDYPDQSFTYPLSNFNNLMNQTGYNGTGSVQDYYIANSFGQLTVVTTVSGWYTASNNHDYYCDECSGADPNNTYRELTREAVDAAETAGVDFSSYDNDLDGVVDGVMIIHEGDGAEYGDNTNVWSHSWVLNPGGTFSDLSVTYDGVLIDDYTMNPETTPDGMGTIGVICHEFGHNLGLPDYYDTDYTGSGGQSFDLGDWDCMAGGSYNNGGTVPANHNSYSRNMLEWQTATELTTPTMVTLPNAAENNESYYYSTPTANEYFWVENRQQVSGTFDEYLPGHGMLIYHIDLNDPGWNTNDINVDPAHNAMDIEEADNIRTSGTVTGDPFPGASSNISFSDGTTPNSIAWSGSGTNKPVTGITENTGVITFAFLGGDPDNPGNFTATPVSSSQIDLSWDLNSGSDPVLVAWSSDGVFGTPVDGITYSAGNSIPGGGTVLYYGSSTSSNHASLVSNTTYFYKAWSNVGSTNYTLGIGSSAKTLCGAVNSFPYTVDFEDLVVPPTCWTSYRGTNGLGTGYDWTSTTTGYNSSGAAFVRYEDVTGGLAEDWLVTPLLSIPGGPIFSLRFYERQTYTTNYGNQYYIKYSTTSQTDIASFSDIVNYDETSFGTSYSQRNVDISAFAGQDIYIAFVMAQDDGDDWYIDEINFSDAPVPTDITWTGTTSSDWSTGSNWSTSNIPTEYSNVIIPTGCGNYPVVDETASCNKLTVQNGGSITITGGANLNVITDIAIGSGTSGSFIMDGGSCSVTGNLYSEVGCNINISGGNLSFANWYRNAASIFSKGTISLSGGTINASGSVFFSISQVTGVMNGPFVFNIGADLYINSNGWGTVTDGSINLLGTGSSTNFFFIPGNVTYASIAYNLTINAPGKNYYLCRSNGSHNMYINNNFAIAAGSALAYNGTYGLSSFDVYGNLTIENSATLTCDGTNDPNINLAGNWINNGGTFTAGSNTVILDGTSQTLSGANTFYDLTKTVTSAAQLSFGTGTSNKTTVAGTLTLQGAAGQLLSLRSTIDDTQWEIDPQSTRTLSYIDVKDSKNINVTNIDACSLVNSGNNTNWDFPVASAGTITGTATVCQGQTGVMYNTPVIINATYYIWTLPTGATITAGDITNNITVSYSNTAVSGDITVQGANLCGSGTVSPSYPVTVNITPTITGKTDGSRCGTGTVDLGATASAGTINWYLASTGSSSLGTGTIFTTPSLSGTTTYYVDATDNVCTTATRTAVTATINTIPAITGTMDGSRCGAGTVDLGATASEGTINWYPASTGGSSLGTGTSFTTPSLSSTTTYYVDATDNGCTTATRAAVTATINTIPTITGTTDGSRCGTGTVDLGASTSAGTINWYPASKGGSSLGTGTSFTTPSLSSTTTYYVDATDNGCTTATRAAVTATINTIPTITSITDGSRCETGTVDLGAITNIGTINWYPDSTGGSSLGTGTGFTTPSLDSTTTYYVEATDSVCTTTATRTAVTATINTIPTITGTTDGSRCGAGTVDLGASTSAGTINWYPASTGGSSLATDTSFTTPSLSGTTTYYVDATDNGCTTATRTAVTATINTIPTITGTTDGSRCGAGTVDLGATANAGTINWYSASTGGSSLDTDTSFTTPGLSSTTTYYVDATDNGCTTATRIAVTATIMNADSCQTNINKISSSDKIKIYPNPTTGMLEVLLSEPFDSDYKIEIFNNLGSLKQEIFKHKNENIFQINLSEYPAGIYLIKIETQKSVYQVKIIKE